jgi:hypothetical protein
VSKWIGGVLAALILVVVAPLMMFIGIGPPPAQAAEPSGEALADIPSELLPVYRSAAEETCHMPWEVLAAIGKLESDHGRSDLPGVHSGTNSAGAAGPMQIVTGTWDAYKIDGDDDGDTDIYDPIDSIWSAANYLCANGAGEEDAASLRNAIWNYNHSDAYVDAVIAQAAKYREAGAVTPGGGDATAILNNPNFTVYSGGRNDLENGVISQKVIDFLAWVLERHSISVSSLKTGHSEFVNGTDRQSNHFFGRGVDISVVDGENVRASSPKSRTLAEEINGLGAGRPDEIGTPWSDMSDLPGYFSDEDHTDHLHIGYDS